MPVRIGDDATAKSIANAFNADIKDVYTAMTVWYTGASNLPLGLRPRDAGSQAGLISGRDALKQLTEAVVKSSTDSTGATVAAAFMSKAVIPFMNILTRVRLMRHVTIRISDWGNRVTSDQTQVAILSNTGFVNIDSSKHKIKSGEAFNSAENMNAFIAYLKSLLEENKNNVYYNEYYFCHDKCHHNHNNRNRR